MNYVIDVCSDEVEIHLDLYEEDRSDEQDARKLELVDEKRESSTVLIMSEQSENNVGLENEHSSTLAEDEAETLPLEYIVFDREEKKVTNALMDDTDDSEDESDHSLDGEVVEVVEILKRTEVTEEATTFMDSNKVDCLQLADSRKPKNKLLKALFVIIIIAAIFVFR